MTKTAYVFVIVIVGLALALHACDEASDRALVGSAASIALYDGVEQACQERNRLRSRVKVLAGILHAEVQPNRIADSLPYENCPRLAQKAVRDFQQQLKDEKVTNKMLQEKLKSLP